MLLGLSAPLPIIRAGKHHGSHQFLGLSARNIQFRLKLRELTPPRGNEAIPFVTPLDSITDKVRSETLFRRFAVGKLALLSLAPERRATFLNSRIDHVGNKPQRNFGH